MTNSEAATRFEPVCEVIRVGGATVAYRNDPTVVHSADRGPRVRPNRRIVLTGEVRTPEEVVALAAALSAFALKLTGNAQNLASRKSDSSSPTQSQVPPTP